MSLTRLRFKHFFPIFALWIGGSWAAYLLLGDGTAQRWASVAALILSIAVVAVFA